MPSPPAKLNPALISALVVLCVAAIALTLCITPDSLSVNLVYQAF
ncbi:MAG: hypothetical protein PW789_16220 [Edaphobacter sp.]|nr:hypothetical protein [Edaphobacter sp.]MDE1178124.1 hypothetical protein [Edaphobacter sp.]